MKNNHNVNENIKIKVANTFSQKLIGLMFKKEKLNYGLLLTNTNGIHTFFMFQNIDVILLDKDYNIVKTIENLKPWKIVLPKKNVKHTLELPTNTAHLFKDKNLKHLNTI